MVSTIILEEVNEKEAYGASLSLIRAGLLVGPSAGFAFAGVNHHLKRLEKTGEIESLRGRHVVFVCPDTPFPYVADYERVLGSKHFPVIENVHLRNKEKVNKQTAPAFVPEISVDTVLSLYSSKLSSENMKINDALLIDVREPGEFNDHHLPDSINVPLTNLPSWIKTRKDNDLAQIVFVCRSGNRSARATYLAKQMGINAYNMNGGTVEWSARNYPRIKSTYCIVR